MREAGGSRGGAVTHCWAVPVVGGLLLSFETSHPPSSRFLTTPYRCLTQKHSHEVLLGIFIADKPSRLAGDSDVCELMTSDVCESCELSPSHLPRPFARAC